MAVATRSTRFLRRKPRFTDLMQQGRGKLTDQSGKHDIQLDWNLNGISAKDKIFKLTFNGQEAYIDLEEVLFYTRSMFK